MEICPSKETIAPISLTPDERLTSSLARTVPNHCLNAKVVNTITTRQGTKVGLQFINLNDENRAFINDIYASKVLNQY